MLLNEQTGTAAVMALLLVLIGIAVLGLVADAGLLAVQSTKLDHATDAAAHAAVKACWITEIDDDVKPPRRYHYIDMDCAHRVAVQYLGANMSGASVDAVTLTARYRVTVRASTTVVHLFAPLWGTKSALLVSESAVTHG